MHPDIHVCTSYSLDAHTHARTKEPYDLNFKQNIDSFGPLVRPNVVLSTASGQYTGDGGNKEIINVEITRVEGVCGGKKLEI